METRVLQRAELTIPSVDISLLKKLAQKFGWSIKFKEGKNKIDQSLEDAAEGRVYTAKDIDDLMDHLLK
ncbi:MULTISPECIES: hypothetical protein [Parabacteroides]|uniref:hypothetical protein n=1 Tax=Parabacteroides leei TaxID=2939491 RepID=UPI0018985C41|nr:hypothetical protein [Parabacteroides goldsteinii]